MNSYDDNNRGFDNRNNRDDRRDGRRETRDSGNGRDDGKTQLFFAKGRNDGMDTETLVDFIVSRTEIDETVMSSIKILDAFSFFAVPEEEAEIILDFFQEEAGEGRPLVSKAKRKTENRDGFGGGRRDDRRDDRRGGGFGGGNGGGGYRNNDRGNDRRDDRGGRRESSFGGNGNSFGGERKPRNC